MMPFYIHGETHIMGIFEIQKQKIVGTFHGTYWGWQIKVPPEDLIQASGNHGSEFLVKLVQEFLPPLPAAIP